MKILVCVKRVVDTNVRVRIKSDHSNVDIEHSKMSLNPFDEIAVEEAVRLKEAGVASEVVVLSIGNSKVEETLRNALARGCDSALLVQSDEPYEPINLATILTKVIEQEKPQLVLLGKQATDDDACQVPAMLAAKLNWSQVTCVSKLTAKDDGLELRREIDGGVEILQAQLPVVFSVDLLLNEPRFIKLPQLMQAKKKPLRVINLNELNLELSQRSRVLSVHDAEVKKQCKFVSSSAELAQLIKQQGLL